MAEQRNKVISKLHSILRPFVLRRLKADVQVCDLNVALSSCRLHEHAGPLVSITILPPMLWNAVCCRMLPSHCACRTTCTQAHLHNGLLHCCPPADLTAPKEGDYRVLQHDGDTAPAEPTDDGQDPDGGWLNFVLCFCTCIVYSSTTETERQLN